MNTTNNPAPLCELKIAADGTLRFLWDDTLVSLLELGEVAIVRASYIEPEGTDWIADLALAGGPRLGPFPKQHDALTAEVDWLRQHGFGTLGSEATLRLTARRGEESK